MAHNMLLDGNTFEDSHSVDRREWVGDAKLGVALTSSRWQLAFASVWRSREFRGRRSMTSSARSPCPLRSDDSSKGVGAVCVAHSQVSRRNTASMRTLSSHRLNGERIAVGAGAEPPMRPARHQR